MGLRTSDQTCLGTSPTGRTASDEVDLKGLEQPVEIFSTLSIVFLENIRTIYTQIQGSSVIVLKP